MAATIPGLEEPSGRPQTSFLHYTPGNPPSFHALSQRFKALDMRYVTKILRSSFEPKDLCKLSDTYGRRSEDSNLRDLMRSFLVYTQIVVFLAPESLSG